MASRNLRVRTLFPALLLGVVASAPAFGGSAVIGTVVGSTKATVGGAALVPNTTIFSGDSLRVKDGVAVVAIGKTSRMVLGLETEASFLRDSNEVTVLITRGNVSLYHPDDSVGLRVKAGEISIAPAKGFKTLGDVAMANGAVVVTTKEGLLRVEGGGPAVEVAKGKTLTVLPKTARVPGKGPAVLNAPGGASGLSTALSVGAVAGGVTSSILAGVAISRANDAKSAATSAATAATQADADAVAAKASGDAATAAAKAAGTAATQADKDALAAKASADAATAAAQAAQATAVAAGCALNQTAKALGVTTSPFTPPAGFPPC